MPINIAPKSLDTELSELMRDVSSGKEQLPEFQRTHIFLLGRGKTKDYYRVYAGIFGDCEGLHVN